MELGSQALARLLPGAILACSDLFILMLRIPHNRLLATLLLSLLVGQTPALIASAGAASAPTINKAQLNQAVQEALAKESGSGSASGSAAELSGSAGSTTGGGGLGTSGALSNLTSGEGEEEASTPTTAASSNASTSGGVFIVRDARSVAPVAEGFGDAGSAQERAARLRKRRAKAKAARQQRKRNR